MITMRNCLVVSLLPCVPCWKSVLVQAVIGYSSLQSWPPRLMTNYHWRIHRVIAQSALVCNEPLQGSLQV